MIDHSQFDESGWWDFIARWRYALRACMHVQTVHDIETAPPPDSMHLLDLTQLPPEAWIT